MSEYQVGQVVVCFSNGHKYENCRIVRVGRTLVDIDTGYGRIKQFRISDQQDSAPPDRNYGDHFRTVEQVKAQQEREAVQAAITKHGLDVNWRRCSLSNSTLYGVLGILEGAQQ